MSSNAFGNVFRITTWGESHGKAIGVVIDGCPAGLAISDDDVNTALIKRAPGNNPHTSPRKEPDLAEIESGIFEGKTTGAPIAIRIKNKDADGSKYEPIKDVLRPGHANYTYLKKYGIFDYRGGGRASARETACRVAAGAIAQKLLDRMNIQVHAYIQSIGGIAVDPSITQQENFITALSTSTIICPDPIAEKEMISLLDKTKNAGDSLGGCVAFYIHNLPVGLGDPVYEKLEANLAKSMMTLPATKGFEIGEGFHAATMRGSTHNDAFQSADNAPTSTNHAGGTLGGISTGMPLLGRVAFKPTSSIKHAQASVNLSGEKQNFQLPEGSRHDPCVAIRAVPVVKAMCQLVLADAVLMGRVARMETNDE